MTWTLASVSRTFRTEPANPWPSHPQDSGPLDFGGQRRQLAADLTLAEARERRRIAEGLHDQVGPLLTLARMQLDAVETSTGRPMADVRNLVCQALTEIRQLTFDLRAPLLESHGLGAALKDLGQRWQAQHGLVCDVVAPDLPLGLDEEWKVFFWRAAREFLWNIVKHAHARQVAVLFGQRDGIVTLQVQDDGIGFQGCRFNASQPVLQTSDEGGFGLPELRRRAEQLGGRLDIETSGRGTCVRISVPTSAATTAWPTAV